MKRILGSERISPLAGFEPGTPCSEVGSANRSAKRMFQLSYEYVVGGNSVLKCIWNGVGVYQYLEWELGLSALWNRVWGVSTLSGLMSQYSAEELLTASPDTDLVDRNMIYILKCLFLC